MKLNFDFCNVENNVMCLIVMSFGAALSIVVISLAIHFSRFLFSIEFSGKVSDVTEQSLQWCERG